MKYSEDVLSYNDWFYLHQFCSEYYTNAKDYDQAIKHCTTSNSFLTKKWKEYIEQIALLQNYIANQDYINIRESLEHKMLEIIFDFNQHYQYLMTSLKNAYDELQIISTINRDLALMDSLTGLYNRRYLYEKINDLYSLAVKDNVSITCVIIDLDDFKVINDKFGHIEGDIVLKRVSSHIKGFFKQSDIVVRYGGDEILILLLDISRSDAEKVAEKLLKTIEKKFLLDYNRDTFQLTVSIGISCSGAVEKPEKDLLNDLIEEADKLLYKAKMNGKNRVELYRP
jgi:diguanylate cyclase (GGDEF)-like protein